MSNLPTWLTSILPPLREPIVLSMAGDEFKLTAPSGETSTFTTLVEVRDALGNEDVKIEPEVFVANGDDADGLNMGLIFSISEHFSGTILGMTDEERLDGLERAYAYSQDCAKTYEAEPNSFLNSYNFLDAHPAFWTTRHGDFDWDTAGHGQRIDHMVMKDDAGNVVIALETGAHVEPAMDSHYHDYRLDVYAATFEEAYVKLAAAVHKFFAPDGEDRGDVEHDKPAWVEELEVRVAEARAHAAEELSTP